jgi:peptide/nickel transport system substrate-binding protein
MRYAAIAAALVVSLATMPTLGFTKTLKWASQGDIMTLDPHSQNEGLNIQANLYVYEPLVAYDENFKLIPVLAESWEQIDPTTVRFKIRPNVKFHDGAPFTAEDVKFSFERAAAPSSQYKSYVSGVKEVNVLDPLTVEVITDGPNPVLLRQLPNLGIMNKAWAEKNNALQPQNFKDNEETFSARNTNGTGPYQLKSREVDVRTVYVENPNWWNKANKKGNVTEIIYTPIKQNATRTAALLSGEVDFVLDPPAQDLNRLRQQLKVLDGNEYRTIFLGMDQDRPELLYSDVKGKNPMKDKRVRQAMYQAIDIDAIKKAVMRDQSIPTGAMISPQVNGYQQALGQRLPYDPAKAKTLLTEAGYPNGFEITLDCPNNRYINDEAICQAISAMWAKVGIKTKLNTMPRATYFPKIQNRDTSVYMLGWGVPTFDALYSLQALIRSKGEGADGSWNHGGYSNPKVDALIDQIKTEIDQEKRNVLIEQALALHAEDVGHIPLHDQIIPWAMKKNVNALHRADNRLVVDWVVID